jgi:hypothetical protein
MLEALEGRLAPAANITILATGTGTLDHFLSATKGTITTADDPGDTAATLSAAALKGVGPGVDVSIAADAAITFDDLGGTLALQTGAGHGATFTTTSGAITFSNTANTLSTAGGGITFSAGTSLTLANLDSGGGAVTLTAGTQAAGDLSLAAVNAAGQVVLVTSTTGAILDGNDPPAGTLNVTALSLALSATTGIGTGAGGAIETQVANLVAQTSTGGIFVANTGDLAIGFSGDPFHGVQATTSGDVDLTSAGSISITTAGEYVRGEGNITVEADGTNADVVTGGMNKPSSFKPILGVSGTLTVKAGHDIKAGGSGGEGDIALHTAGAGAVVLTAGHNVVVDNNSLVGVNSLPMAPGGLATLAVTAGHNITVQGGAAFNTADADLSLTTGAGGTLTLSGNSTNTGDAVDSRIAPPGTTGGNITISADKMVLNGGINSGTGTVTLQQATGGAGSTTQNIDVGLGATFGDLGLSDGELGQVTAGALVIGRPDNAGNITVTGPVTAHAGFSTLELSSGGSVSQTGLASITVTNLAVTAAGGVGTAATPIQTALSSFAASAGTGGVFVGNTGATMSVGTVAGVSGVAATGGAVTLSTSGSLAVSAPVSTATSGANAGAVTLAGSGTITVEGAVSGSAASVLGGAGDDTITVKPSAVTAITVNGGAHVTGDTLNYDTAGLSGIDVLASEITAAGVQPVSYSNVQAVNPPFADAFDRADSATLGSAWTQQAGQFAVSSQKAVSQAALSLATASGLTLADAAVSADVAVPAVNGSLAGLLTRYAGPGDGHSYLGGIYFASGSYHAGLWRNVTGAWYLMQSRALAGSKGSGNVRLENFGKDLELFVNNALQVAAADAALTSGLVGMRATLNATLDNFVVSREMAPAFQDGFDRLNSPTLGPSWANPISGLVVASDQARGTAALSLATVAAVTLADVTVSADVAVPPVNGKMAGLAARYSGPGGANMYLGAIVFSGGAYQAVITRNLGGTWTQLGAANLAGSIVQRHVQFQVVGTRLQLFVDGTLEVSVTDSALSAGGVGLWTRQGGTFVNFSF